MNAIRCGVVGFGLAGRIFHCAVIHAVEGLELAGIVQRSGNDAAAAYPGIPVYRTLEEMLAAGTVDAVSLATPNSTHAPLARTCLLAGKHVVVDKPFTITSAEAADLIRLARDQRRVLTVYQNRRWDGDFLTLQQLLGSGELGALRSFRSRFDRFRPQPKSGAWREDRSAGGGLLYDLGAHLIDQSLVLFGKPDALWADVRTERAAAAADDAFDLRLYYPGHAVWLGASCLSTPPTLRYDAGGTQGSYRKFGLDPQEDTLRTGDLFQSSPWGLEDESSWGILTTASGSGPQQRAIPTEPGDYRNFYRRFRDAIRAQAEPGGEAVRVPALPPVDPLDAWRSLRIIELAFESSRQRALLPCNWSGEPV